MCNTLTVSRDWQESNYASAAKISINISFHLQQSSANNIKTAAAADEPDLLIFFSQSCLCLSKIRTKTNNAVTTHSTVTSFVPPPPPLSPASSGFRRDCNNNKLFKKRKENKKNQAHGKIPCGDYFQWKPTKQVSSPKNDDLS